MIKIKKNYITLIVFIIVSSQIAGCGSITYRTRPAIKGMYVSPELSRAVYPGVRRDIYQIKDTSSAAKWIGQGGATFFCITSILDIPLSFVIDTLCLPYDIFQSDKESIKQNEEDYNKEELKKIQ
ncbi:MAG: YceK/YidQ family lipoprotein [bacterium]